MNKALSIYYAVNSIESAVLLGYLANVLHSPGQPLLPYSAKSLVLLSFVFLVALIFAFAGKLSWQVNNKQSNRLLNFLEKKNGGSWLLVWLWCVLLALIIAFVILDASQLPYYPILTVFSLWIGLIAVQTSLVINVTDDFRTSIAVLIAEKIFAWSNWIRLKRINWPAILLGTTTVGALYFFSIPFLKNQVILDSEAYTFANVPIEFALYNEFRYSAVGQQFFYFPGINVFIMNAPLYFLLGGFLLKVVGIGVWQILLPAFLTILFIILFTISVAYRVYGYSTAIVAAMLCSVFYFLTDRWQAGRPDPLLGLFYAIFLVGLYVTWFKDISSHWRKALSFLLGVMAILMMASHWQGIYGFLYFPIHIYMLHRRKQPWLLHALLFGLGSGIVFVLWGLFYGYYGESFLNILFALQANNSRNVVRLQGLNPLQIFIPLRYFPGGWVVSIGILLFVVYYILLSIKPSQKLFQQRQLTPPFLMSQLDLLLLFSLVGWFVFYYFLIINRHYQYLSNILFPMLLLSARGYVLTWCGIKAFISKHQTIYNIVRMAIILIVVVYLYQNLNWTNPLSLQPPNTVYLATRRTLEKFVDNQYSLFLGVEAYHYLYDYDYKTNMWQESKAALETKSRRLFWDAPELTLSQRSDLAKEGGQIMIMPDENGMYQSKFYDERIWSPHFKKVAAVFAPGLNSALPVWYRNDIADTLFNRLQLTPNTSGCDDGVLWIVYDPGNDALSGITREQWKTLSQSDKERVVINYFNQHQWFGQTNIKSPEQILESAVILTDQYFLIQKSQEKAFLDYWNIHLERYRTFEDAMEYFINLNLRTDLCSQ